MKPAPTKGFTEVNNIKSLTHSSQLLKELPNWPSDAGFV